NPQPIHHDGLGRDTLLFCIPGNGFGFLVVAIIAGNEDFLDLLLFVELDGRFNSLAGDITQGEIGIDLGAENNRIVLRRHHFYRCKDLRAKSQSDPNLRNDKEYADNTSKQCEALNNQLKFSASYYQEGSMFMVLQFR